MVGVRRERTRRVSPRRGAAAGRRRGAGERSARRGGGGDGRARGARGARGRRPGGAEARARGGVPMIDHRASRRTSTARPYSRAPRGCAPRRPASTRGRRGRARAPRRGPSARSPWTSGRASRARASRRARPRARARASADTSTKRSACRVMRFEPPSRTAATRDDRDLARAADLNVRSVAVFPSARPQQSRSLHASRISRPRRAPRLVRDGLRDVRRRG